LTDGKTTPAAEPAGGTFRAYYALAALVLGLVAGMRAGNLS